MHAVVSRVYVISHAGMESCLVHVDAWSALQENPPPAILDALASAGLQVLGWCACLPKLA